MVASIRLKVCGLTTAEAAEAAAKSGADYLGFNFYPKSPRFLPWKKYRDLVPGLPAVPRAAVVVEPTAEELEALFQTGFDAFQVHFRPEIDEAVLAEWSSAVGPEKLWLAPKLPPGAEVRADWLPWAETFLLDGYSADRFGGSGRPGDWAGFARQSAKYPDKTWILAGGLNAENVAAAVRESGATFVDVNSGVESAPGLKDPAKIRAFAEALKRAAL